MLINLRNALMAGKRLPYDAEVEYLESTGTQWIDTGVPCGGDTTFDLSVYAQVAGSMLFGASQAYQTNGIYAFIGNNNALYANYKNNEFLILPSADSVNAWLSISKTSNTWKVNGSIVYTQSPETFSSGETFALFCRKQNGKPLGMKSGVRFASCKLFNDNGVLVRDYIPVRKGTVGYLYDRVSGKLFGNAGTGDFVLGPDVVPVEYIESTGTQYINTGLKYFPDFDVSIEVPSGQRNATIYCDATHILERIGSSTPYWQIYAGDRLQSSVRVYGFHRVQFKASSLTIDGQAIGTISNRTWADGATCYIGFNGNNIYVYKLYGCQMWDINNNATRNYKPVRVGTGSTWEGALMDVLTRRIYRNAGSGAFTYGNDLKYPIPAE